MRSMTKKKCWACDNVKSDQCDFCRDCLEIMKSRLFNSPLVRNFLDPDEVTDGYVVPGSTTG